MTARCGRRREIRSRENGRCAEVGEDLLELEPEERAQQGVFLAFQYPVEIPGVANNDFLRLAVNKRRQASPPAARGTEEGRRVCAYVCASVLDSPLPRSAGAGPGRVRPDRVLRRLEREDEPGPCHPAKGPCPRHVHDMHMCMSTTPVLFDRSPTRPSASKSCRRASWCGRACPRHVHDTSTTRPRETRPRHAPAARSR